MEDLFAKEDYATKDSRIKNAIQLDSEISKCISEYMSEEVVKQFNDSCNYPSPEIALHEGLPIYTQDFSCGGITLHDGYRLTTNQPQSSLFKIHVFDFYTCREMS